MVNAFSPARPAAIDCREIGAEDVNAIADLLTCGFPGRQKSYWLRGLARMEALGVPDGYPRFGYMMLSAGKPVGVILTLYRAFLNSQGECSVRCNLSSWYVEPAFRSCASLLISQALKPRDVTYINLTPAPSTWPIVEAQGFRRFSEGQFFAFPALSFKGTGFGVSTISSAETDLPQAERAILDDHARFGCLSLVCRTPKDDAPFVFAPFSVKSGRLSLPFMRLIYCRDMANFVACAGALGRFLLRRGVMSVLLDVKDSRPALPGVYSERLGRKYFKGPNPPRLGDLTYSELVVFGP
nr:acyl-CoA acyltransferase [uncultured Methylovirgula sp.]